MESSEAMGNNILPTATGNQTEQKETSSKDVVAKALKINKRPKDDDSSDDEETANQTNTANQPTLEDEKSGSSSKSDDGPPHIPYNALTEFQEKQLYGKYYQIRRDIISALDDSEYDDGSWGTLT